MPFEVGVCAGSLRYSIAINKETDLNHKVGGLNEKSIFSKGKCSDKHETSYELSSFDLL